MGPLPMSGKRNAYILTAVDYLSRWAEAKAVKQITSKEMGKFVYEQICCKFGLPLELLSDRGPGFRGELFDFLCKMLNIQQRYSSPYYPQCNGLNERFNGELVKILTKMIQTHERIWDSELPCALWVYRTAVKTSRGFSPYHLVYGKKVLLPIEVEIPALKSLLLRDEEKSVAWQKRLKKYLARLMTVVTDEMLSIKEKDEEKIKEKNESANFTGTFILVNNSVVKAQRGIANGFSTSVMSFFQAVGPACAGALFSWSEEREDASFLPGMWMVFSILSALSFLAFLTTFEHVLPNSLNQPIQ
ncbi:hypothetical protein L7F22_040786 [Adiantum nelumboides]|nr:hypothetical protein [Adiantum nelumboides]